MQKKKVMIKIHDEMFRLVKSSGNRNNNTLHHCRTRLDWRLLPLTVAVAAQSRIRNKAKITNCINDSS